MPSPECVAQNRNRMCARQTIVISLDGPADLSLDSQRFEVVSGDDFDIDKFGAAWSDPNRLFDGSRGEAGEDGSLRKRLVKLITRSAAGLPAIGFGQENKLFRSPDGQASKQHGICHAED